MNHFEPHQRCELCEYKDKPGCVEARHIQAECAKAVREGQGRAERHGTHLPAGFAVVIACPSFWRAGRRHG